MEKADKYKFKCPDCGCERLEEALSNCFVLSEIKDIFYIYNPISEENEVELEYGDDTIEDGTVEHYQCIQCGFTVTDSRHDIVDKIIEHGWGEKIE